MISIDGSSSLRPRAQMRQPAPATYPFAGAILIIAAQVMIVVVVELPPGGAGKGVAARIIAKAFLPIDALLPMVVLLPPQVGHVRADSSAGQGYEVGTNP